MMDQTWSLCFTYYTCVSINQYYCLQVLNMKQFLFMKKNTFFLWIILIAICPIFNLNNYNK
jgi:hypothetical protein